MPASWHGRRLRRGARFKGVKFTMVKHLFIFIGLLLCHTNIFATEQISESISIGDGTFRFDGYPLEQLISKDDFIEKYEVEDLCSAAWRGYQGQWRIMRDVLYLEALIKNPCGFNGGRGLFSLKKLFPDYGQPYSLKKADWFSGEIIIPIDEYKEDTTRKTSSGHFVLVHEAVVYKIKDGKVESRKIEVRDR